MEHYKVFKRKIKGFKEALLGKRTKYYLLILLIVMSSTCLIKSYKKYESEYFQSLLQLQNIQSKEKPLSHLNERYIGRYNLFFETRNQNQASRKSSTLQFGDILWQAGISYINMTDSNNSLLFLYPDNIYNRDTKKTTPFEMRGEMDATYSSSDVTVKDIDIYKVNIMQTEISGNSASANHIELKENSSMNFSFIYGRSDYLFLNGIKLNGDITKCHIDTLDFSNCILNDFKIVTTNIHRLSINNCKLAEGFVLKNSTPPKFIEINDLDFSDSKQNLDLTQFNFLPSDKVYLTSSSTDLSKIKLNYEHFQLLFPDSVRVEFKDNIYKLLLDNQKVEGFVDGYQKLDKEYKKFSYYKTGSLTDKINNYIDKVWWDYGYNKSLIIRNSFILFLFFFIINLLFFEPLILEVYKLDSVSIVYGHLVQRSSLVKGFKFYIYRSIYCFIFSLFVFWGLKLDMEKISIRKIELFLFIIVQYLTGIICLAYIANLIITK